MRTSPTRRLLAWYDAHHRALPWREQRDPWAIWVSEIMLQQTRVEVVARLYPAFLQKFPTPAALAEASDDTLLAAWRGLGYYNRARLLRAAAQRLIAEHGGEVPASVDGLRSLPGVGEYTAGAIGSIAFGLAVPAVDGNVERVLARHRAIEDPPKRQPAAGEIRATAADWLDQRRPGDFNQALMELGATVCTPKTPRCDDCPLAVDCVARARGIVDQLPAVPRRRAMVEVVARALLVPVSRGRVLGTRIAEGEVNQGQLELPGAGLLVPAPNPGDLESALRARFGISTRVGPVVTTVRHSITHHRIRLIVHQAQHPIRPGPNLTAARPDDALVPWTTAARKVFAKAALFLAARG